MPVVGYCTDVLPAFYSRHSEYPVDYRCDSAAEIAAAMHAKWEMGLHGGMVVANPVPAEHSFDSDEIEMEIESALKSMQSEGIAGKATTPYLLKRIAELTDGRSLETNIALVLNNAELAAKIAASYRKHV